MALNTKQLSVLAYANLFSVWYYKTKTGEIIDNDYFEQCKNIFNEGDEIIVNYYDDVVHSKGLTETRKLVVIRNNDKLEIGTKSVEIYGNFDIKGKLR